MVEYFIMEKDKGHQKQTSKVLPCQEIKVLSCQEYTVTCLFFNKNIFFLLSDLRWRSRWSPEVKSHRRDFLII